LNVIKVCTTTQPGFDIEKHPPSYEGGFKRALQLCDGRVYLYFVLHAVTLFVGFFTALFLVESLELVWWMLYLTIVLLHIVMVLASQFVYDLRNEISSLATSDLSTGGYQATALDEDGYLAYGVSMPNKVLIFVFAGLCIVGYVVVYRATQRYRQHHSWMRSNFLHEGASYLHSCRGELLPIPNLAVDGNPGTGIIVNRLESEEVTMRVSMPSEYHFCSLGLHLDPLEQYTLEIFQEGTQRFSESFQGSTQGSTQGSFHTLVHPAVTGDVLVIHCNCSLRTTQLEAFRTFMGTPPVRNDSSAASETLASETLASETLASETLSSTCKDPYLDIPLIFLIYMIVSLSLLGAILVFMYNLDPIIKGRTLREPARTTLRVLYGV
jgi:hypothetical protein